MEIRYLLRRILLFSFIVVWEYCEYIDINLFMFKIFVKKFIVLVEMVSLSRFNWLFFFLIDVISVWMMLVLLMWYLLMVILLFVLINLLFRFCRSVR